MIKMVKYDEKYTSLDQKQADDHKTLSHYFLETFLWILYAFLMQKSVLFYIYSIWTDFLGSFNACAFF